MVESKTTNFKHIPPVAVFGFNRPECLIQVFDRVRAATPRKLFLVLDAPREDRPEEVLKWEECKKIFDGVDWDCEVHHNYAKENMGCRWRMTTGISWVFEHVDEAVLLEDDCVPHPDFFRFCAELLERYQDDSRIGMIAGHLAHFQIIDHPESYYFDRFNMIWGWATWKRAWKMFDQQMEEWPRFKQRDYLTSVLGRRSSLIKAFDAVYSGHLSSWATAWYLSCLRQNFLCIHPTSNLITNVGVEGDHNSGRSNWHFIPSSGIAFPLAHPRDIIPSPEDEFVMRLRYGHKNILQRIRSFVLRRIRLLLKS